MRYHKKWGKPCGVLTVFCELVFTARTFQNINFKLFLRIHLHSQNLPEAYSWMRGKKQTQNQNLPEAYTWMRYNKKEGKPCGVFPFFLTSFSQPGPAGTIHLNQTKKNTGTHNTWMNEIQKRKTMWRFNFFCELVSTARMFQNTHLNETELKKTWKACGVFSFFDFISTARTFQKPTAAWEAKNKPTAKSFQKPTPEWDTIKKKEPCCVLPFSFWVHFHSQDLPEPYTRKHNTWMNEIQKNRKTMWRFNFFCELVSTARIFQNTYLKETGEKTWQPCGVLSCFFMIRLHGQDLPEAYSRMSGKKVDHCQNLPEAYTWMRYKKKVKTLWRFNFFLWIDFHSKNLPEPYTSMRPKNTGKPCGVLSFFVVHLHSQHVPAEWETKTKTKLKPSRSLSLHGTMGPEKTRKTMWRFNFFCELIFTTSSKLLPCTGWQRGGLDAGITRPPFAHQCKRFALTWVLWLPCSASSFPAPPHRFIHFLR